MGERFHVATFVWGLLLTASGLALLGVGLDWWSFEVIDMKYAAPILVIVVGLAILLASLSGHRRGPTDRHEKA